MKVRRQMIEAKLLEFRDAAEYLLDRPLLLWSPKIDRITKSLMRAITKHKQRSQAWKEKER